MNRTNIMRTAALITSLGICFGITGCGKKEPEEAVRSLNISGTISAAKELTTLKYEYTDFGVYEKEANQVSLPVLGTVDVPLTKDQLIFTFGGTISIGFDLNDVTETVDDTAKTITIEIPEPTVLSHTPNHDVEQVYSLQQSITTSTTDQIQNYSNKIAELRKEKEDVLMEDQSVKDEAVKEFKDTVEGWLLKKDALVSEYTIIWK